MESKINKVRKDLRALKKNSHAISRLIEIQGLHFTRIKALSELPQSDTIKSAIEREKELISALGLEKKISENENLEKTYLTVLNSLSLRDKAIMLDCFVNGLPYWKIALEYGFAEEGARKHIDAIVKRIAETV